MKLRRKLLVTHFVLALIGFTFICNATTLSITINEDPNLVKWIEELKAGYEDTHKDVTIKLNRIISKDNDYSTKLAMMLPSDESQDIIWLDAYQFYNFCRGKLIAPIPGIKNWKDRENFYQNMLNQFIYDNEYYGIPINAVVVGLFYNKEIFKKAGITVPWNPKNWNDIYTAAEKIKKNVSGVWPLSFSILPTESSSFGTFLMFLYGAENGRLYQNGKWKITSKGLYNSFNFLYKLINEKLTAPVPVLLQNIPQIAEKKYMPENKIGIRLDGCWIKRYWRGKLAKTKEVYGFAPMPTEFGQEPGFVSMQGNWCFTISSKSKNKKLAADFIKYAADYNNALRYVNIMSDLSPRKDIVKDKAFPEDLKAFPQYLKYSVFRPLAEDYPYVSNELCVAFQQLLMPGGNPLKAMNIFADNVELSLGKDKVERLYKEEHK
jgi:multiple sugar transport system substrate-binding protein